MDNINDICTVLNKIRCNGVTEDILEELLWILIPKDGDKLITPYDLNGKKNKTAFFQPQVDKIFLNCKRLNEWVVENRDLDSEFGITLSDEDFKAYLTVFAVSHEVYHSIQYDVAYGKIEGEYEALNKVYKDVFNLFCGSSIIPGADLIRQVRLLLYKFKENMLILERNANVEAFRLLKRASEWEENDKANDLFNTLYDLILKMGYQGQYNGSLEETYNRILMGYKMKKINIREDIDEETRKRNGFPLLKKMQ